VNKVVQSSDKSPCLDASSQPTHAQGRAAALTRSAMADGGKGGDEYLFKVLVVGAVGGGKTSVVRRYVYNNFSENYQATIGADFALKIIRCKDGNVIRLQLWDIAGQERFGNMTRVYFKGAVGAIVVHDINTLRTKPDTSFDDPRRWKKELDDHVRGSRSASGDAGGVPTLLLANKADLWPEGSELPTKQLDDFAAEAGFFKWRETSAKKGTNVDEAITLLVEEVMRTQGVSGQKDEKYTVVKVGDEAAADGGCC